MLIALVVRRITPPWYIPTNNNPVYLNACANDIYSSVPYNGTKGFSFQYARTGDAYIYLDYINGSLRTYIQVKLSDSLKKGAMYYAEHFINIPNPLELACNNVGMLFTKNAIYVDTVAHYSGTLNANPQIVNYGNPILGDTANWLKVSGIFKAQGGERFLTLGNFKSTQQTTLLQIQPTGYYGAGYYIDDVSVIPLDSFNLKADAGRDTTITTGDSAFIGTYTNGIDSIKWQILNSNNTIDSIRPGFWVHPTVNTCYVVTQTVNGYTSSDTVCVTVSTVPLKFLKYEVQSTSEKQVENKWSTANEVNVSHFYVQRSTNGRDFVIIHKEQAQNKALNNYSFVDNMSNLLPSPLGEGLGVRLYYRIVSVDKDGKISFSEVRELITNHSSLNTIAVYPNPSTDFVTVKCKDAKEVMIIDCWGRVVYREILRQAQNDAVTINCKKLNRGLYVVQVINANGELYNKKLLVE